MRFFEKCREIGPALWLYWAYWENAAEDDGSEWLPVLGKGISVRDRDAARILDVSVPTIACWRKKLECAGAIRTRRGICGHEVWIRIPGRGPKRKHSPAEAWEWPLASENLQ